MKKREKYGTIIVDNDKHERIEVINSREQAEVEDILKQFKKIKTVTRDFSITYKKAIEATHPKAKQIADRFHIFKNLTEDVGEYMKRTVRERIKIMNMGVEINDTKIIFSGKPRRLDSWLKKADSLATPEFTKFTNLLGSDIKAVKNAITYQQYSNGLTEGFNNKTKVIKRIMYGRCSFDLFRLKILAFN